MTFENMSKLELTEKDNNMASYDGRWDVKTYLRVNKGQIYSANTCLALNKLLRKEIKA
jgi:hypothetical protein